jgi:hypothetical protein
MQRDCKWVAPKFRSLWVIAAGGAWDPAIYARGLESAVDTVAYDARLSSPTAAFACDQVRYSTACPALPCPRHWLVSWY